MAFATESLKVVVGAFGKKAVSAAVFAFAKRDR